MGTGRQQSPRPSFRSLRHFAPITEGIDPPFPFHRNSTFRSPVQHQPSPQAHVGPAACPTPATSRKPPRNEPERAPSTQHCSWMRRSALCPRIPQALGTRCSTAQQGTDRESANQRIRHYVTTSQRHKYFPLSSAPPGKQTGQTEFVRRANPPFVTCAARTCPPRIDAYHTVPPRGHAARREPCFRGATWRPARKSRSDLCSRNSSTAVPVYTG